MERPRLESAFECAFPACEWPQLAQTGVLVALADLRPWRPWLEQAWGLLDAAQRGRAQRQRRAPDRDTLVLSYALHRLALGRAMGMPPREVPLGRDALGCPRLDGTAMHTSLSHGGEAAAIAVAARGPVGVDLEPASRAAELPAIAERVCHPVEAEQLEMLPPLQRPAWLLALWVRKEAFLKAEGVGLMREMSDFVASVEQPIASSSQPGTQIQVRMLDAGAVGVLAVAAPPGAALHLARLEPID